MKINKRFKAGLIFLSFIATFLIAIYSFWDISSTANAIEISTINTETKFNGFKDMQIESSGYLYNFDDSADYIFVNFANHKGYAIFANETMELLEYSFAGELPYKDLKNDKYYYGGPNLYLVKNQDIFIDVLNGESFNYSWSESYENAQTIRNMFSMTTQNIDISLSTFNIENKLKSIQIEVDKLSTSPLDPPLDENNWISPTDGAKYIKNSEYFLTKGAAPKHGLNTQGSCTTVATQLLLSYNNYYYDRRIIAPEYLYGGWNGSVDNNILNPQNYSNPSQNVNVCTNPDEKTSYILGSTQAYHDYLYNNGVTSWIWNAADNLRPLLNTRNIDYTIYEKHSSTNVAISSNDIINELNDGYPLVLAMSSSLNGTPYEGQRAFNHAVIAYGYQELAPYSNDTNSYLGYIVHLGWDNEGKGNNINVWTNSSWYYNYMSLHINHTHNYNVISDEEVICGECNHRVVKNFNFKDIGNNNIEIVSLNKRLSDDLIIPETLYGKNVTEIGSHAFEGLSWLKSVSIPYTVKNIGFQAFANASALESVLFLDNELKNDAGYTITENHLETIGDGAFMNCTALTSINIPYSVKTIYSYAFWNCTKLRTVTFSDNEQTSNLYNIAYAAFGECSNLYRMTLPASLERIEGNAFQNTTLEYLQVEEGSRLNRIDSAAFINSSLKVFDVPLALQNIGTNAFRGSKLTSIVLTGNVTKIGANAFAECSNLTIYTSFSSNNILSGWDADWNSSNRPVVFDCEMDLDIPYVVSFNKSVSNPININVENGLKNPDHNVYDFKGWYTTSDFSGTKYTDLTTAPNGKLYAKWAEKKESCVAEGTMITLADGSQVAVENLKGDEQLLVWNMLTGKFDSAPILFIDSDPQCEYEVINLSFSDGTTVKVISEHAFWDFDLNEYVFLRSDASKYIGHWFNKQITNGNGELEWTKVQLVGVELTKEITTAWSPVTYGHLCYYVNGMLSMPGATDGLINIFEVDAESMKVDEAAFAQDIEKYGLFTYKEFAEILPVPEYVFDAFGGQYLKVAIGKGLTSIEELAELLQRYEKFFC